MIPHQPYIGITGVTQKQEVAALLSKELTELLQEKKRAVMLGVLVTDLTVKGKKPRNPNRYPPITAVQDLFVEHPSAVVLLHLYAGRRPLQQVLQELLERCPGEYWHGLQLNATWPSPETLSWLREKAPNKRIVLQIGPDALTSLSNDETKVSEKLASEYKGLCDDILVDASGGRGKPFSTKRAEPMLRAIQARCPGLGLGIAGGLGPSSIDRVAPLLKEFSALNLDAESQLRDHLDHLDLDKATTYIKGALQALPKPA